MDTDIITLANSFVQENSGLQTKMTPNDVNLISSWIQVQLLRERHSWKEKLDHAMAEIERQRKTALTWEAKFENSGKVTDGKVTVDAETSTSQENLALLVQSQKKRINQIQKQLQGLLNDRKACFEVLKMDNSERDIAISQVLRQTLRNHEKDLKKNECNFRKELTQKDQELKCLREDKESLKDQINDCQKKLKDMVSQEEKGMRVLCYTTTDKMFQSPARTPRDHLSNGDVQPYVDNLYNEKVRLNTDNKRLNDAILSLEEEIREKDSLLRKYEKQIKSLKFESTYRQAADHSRKKAKPEKKTDTLAPISDTFRRQYPGELSLNKFKAKYSSLPSLPLARSAEGANDNNSSSPTIQAAKTAVHRCLRCNRLYRLMDNNKFACHYHNKGRIREETLAPNGQVLSTNYRWECCNGSSSSDGCCASKHV